MLSRAHKIVAEFEPVFHCLTIFDPHTPPIETARYYLEIRATMTKHATDYSHNAFVILAIAFSNNFLYFLWGHSFD